MTSTSPVGTLILLVEDEPIIGYEIESMLTDVGYRVLGPLRSRQSAMEAAANPDIAVAVVDLVLTDGPSQDVVEHLLSLDLPVVVTSGLNEQPTLTERCAGWFVKPYDPERLIDLIRGLVPAPRP